MKKLLVVLSIPLYLCGYQYETVLLKTQAKLTPRLLLMTDGVAFEAQNRFTVCIVREPGEEAVAGTFRDTLLAYYPSGWQYHTMQIVESPYETLEETCAGSEVLYLLNSSEANVRRAVAFATAKRKLTVSYENSYLSYGVLLSLHVGRSVRPYLNLLQAKRAHIRFDSDLKRISKFLDVPKAEE